MSLLCLTFLLQTFLSSSSCPEIHGYLHAKEHGRKSWKKFYFVLRRSGLYFSNKGTSKVGSDPSHSRCYTCSAFGFWLAKTLHPLISMPQSLQGLALIIHNTTWSYLLQSVCLKCILSCEIMQKIKSRWFIQVLLFWHF